MKTPDEIKKGIECCSCDPMERRCEGCPYADGGCETTTCERELGADTLALIQQLEAQVLKWISVKERLPESYETVIIWRSDCYEASIGWNFQPGWSVPKGVEVTHWMPLPERPKE